MRGMIRGWGEGEAKQGGYVKMIKIIKKNADQIDRPNQDGFLGKKPRKKESLGIKWGYGFSVRDTVFFGWLFFFVTCELVFVTLSPCLVISPVLVLVFHPWRWVATCNLQGVIKPPRRQVDTRAHLPPGGTSLES